ncbi:hypothetical protein UR09_00375 [Candidatus Nitromaritima sp. SCGC AAA799-A02]|nr:hypothetical protein UR09_00375 [Candidatus Nitromaritima sp. SCGC AAA799-A02]
MTRRASDKPVLFVFLGASNLARAFSGLTHCLTRALSPRPAEFIHAMGPGRGYIAEGGIFNAVYPPILDCGILEAADKKASHYESIMVLVTDIGNDIMYGVPPEKVVSGLQTLLGTFGEMGANIFITAIPVDLERDVGESYFHILRHIFFPKSRVEYLQAVEAVRAVNRSIKETGSEKKSGCS